MIITYHGQQYFKLQVGDITFALNPTEQDDTIKGKPAKFGADVALSSTQHPSFCGFDNVTYGDKEPFRIDGPGSYEVLDHYIQGLSSTTLLEGKEYINTVYYFTFDGMKILFLGALVSKELSKEVLEEVEEVDIIFVPVGDGFLMPGEAHKLAVSFSPKVIIPMSYDKKSLEQFLKEGGDPSVKLLDKLTLKAKDLSDKKADIIPLAV